MDTRPNIAEKHLKSGPLEYRETYGVIKVLLSESNGVNLIPSPATMFRAKFSAPKLFCRQSSKSFASWQDVRARCGDGAPPNQFRGAPDSVH